MHRLRILIPILVVSFCFGATAQGQVKPQRLRQIFKVREVTWDEASSRLALRWTFSNEEELRAFETLSGPPPELTEDRALGIRPRSMIQWREVRMTAPCRIEMTVTLRRPSSYFSLLFTPVDDAGDTVRLSFNKPIRTGTTKAERSDAINVFQGGVKKAQRGVERTWLTHPEPNRIVIELETEEIVISVGEFKRAIPVRMPSRFAIAALSRRGGIRISDLVVDGIADKRSIEKLLRAGLSVRKGEKSKGGGRKSSPFNAARDVQRDERRETIQSLRERVKKGKFGRLIRVGSNDARLRRAVRAMNDRKPAGRAELVAMAKQFPKATYLAYLAAQNARDARQLDEFDKLLERAVEVDRFFVEGWRAMGMEHLRHNRLDQALKCLQTAHGIRREGWTQAALAVVHMTRGEFSKAAPLVAKARARLKDFGSVDRLADFLQLVRKGPFTGRNRQRESEHYVVRTNLDEETLDVIVKRLERFRAFLLVAFPLPQKSDVKSRVWVFDSKEEYMAFTDAIWDRLEHSLGVFHPKLNTLLLFESMNDHQNTEVLQHEGFHQYLRAAVKAPPIWFDEGYAEYLGATRYDPAAKPVVGGLLQGRISTLRRHLSKGGKLLSFDALMNKPRGLFMGAGVGLHYAQSWAMIHFFEESPEESPRRAFARYREAILAGGSQSVAWKAFARSKKLVQSLERAFDDHVREELLGDETPETKEKKK